MSICYSLQWLDGKQQQHTTTIWPERNPFHSFDMLTFVGPGGQYQAGHPHLLPGTHPAQVQPGQLCL